MKITDDRELTISVDEAEALAMVNDGLRKFREWLTTQLQCSVKEIRDGVTINDYITIQVVEDADYAELGGDELSEPSDL